MKKIPVEVSINELAEILDHYLNTAARLNYAIKIVGHPGVGKSSIVKQVAERNRFYFIDTRLAFKENIDLGGYPVPDHENRRMIYYRPKFIPPEKVPEGYNGILWFLDEANRAHPTVIQTLFQIITEQVCGEHRLPAKTAIILAGNLGEEDETQLTEFHDAALDGRLAIFHLKPTADDWLRWAQKVQIHPSIMTYIALFPDKLWHEENIHPNPRGWHQVSQALQHSFRIPSEKELTTALRERSAIALNKMIIALLGDVTGFDFITQLTAPRAISTEDLLTGNPEKLSLMQREKLPAEDILWAVTGALALFRNLNRQRQNLFQEEDLDRLKNLLVFMGVARADTRMSFFYRLLKECGIFTQIPHALKRITDADTRTDLKSKYEAFLNLTEEP